MAILELERLGPASPPSAAPSASSAPPAPGLEVAARAKPAEETSTLEIDCMAGQPTPPLEDHTV